MRTAPESMRKVTAGSVEVRVTPNSSKLSKVVSSMIGYVTQIIASVIKGKYVTGMDPPM